MLDRLLAICIFATAAHFVPVCALYYLALCSWAIVICSPENPTDFSILMLLWAVELYYASEYFSVFVAVYFEAFATCYNTPVSFFFIYDCIPLLETMVWKLFRHASLLFA